MNSIHCLQLVIKPKMAAYRQYHFVKNEYPMYQTTFSV